MKKNDNPDFAKAEEALRLKFMEGKWDMKTARNYFTELEKVQQKLIFTKRGAYIFLEEENRYRFVKKTTEVCIWLGEELKKVSPEAEYLMDSDRLQKLYKNLSMGQLFQGDEDDFDNEPNLINTKGGVLRITSENAVEVLDASDVDTKFTVCVNACYIKELDKRSSKAINRLLEESFAADDRKENGMLLFSVLGYLYSNFRNIKFLACCWGDPNTGKSSLQKMFQISVGGNKCIEEGIITNIALHQIGQQGTIKAITQARWNISGDTSGKCIKNVELLKSLTSHEAVGETIQGEYSGYHSKCKIWIAGNWDALTAMEDLEAEALKVRCIPILFEKQTEARKDGLLDDLLEDIDSVFSWAMDRLVELIKRNFEFVKPRYTEEKLARHIGEANSFLAFLRDCFEPDENAILYFDDVYAKYTIYYTEMNLTAESQQRCRELFYKRTQSTRPVDETGSRKRGRKGLRLITEMFEGDRLNLNYMPEKMRGLDPLDLLDEIKKHGLPDKFCQLLCKYATSFAEEVQENNLLRKDDPYFEDEKEWEYFSDEY